MDRADKSLRQGPLWLSVISVGLIVAAVIAALAATQRLSIGGFGAPPSTGFLSTREIAFDTSAGLVHPQDAAFSPDGERIAVIGAFTPCQQLTPGLPRCGHGLAIYNSHTGALIQVSPIEPLLGVTTPEESADHVRGAGGYVNLNGLGWSPDSVWFAMVYTIFDTPNPASPDDMLDSGLLLVNPQTGATQIIRGDSGYFSALSGVPTGAPIWHVVSGTQTLGYTTAPGVIFAWNTEGAPFPTQVAHGSLDELPANAGARYPVGQPDGSAPFTVWQPGIVIGPGSAGVGGGRSAFVTSFATWSADSANAGIVTEGLTLPTPVKALASVSAAAGTAGPAITEPAAMLATPARDVALAHVQEAVGAYGWALVAWKPSGTALASVVCFERKGQTLELRDTASGAIIGSASLNLQPGDPGCRDAAAKNLSLVWSPGGSTLLTVDRAASTLTLRTVSAAV